MNRALTSYFLGFICVQVLIGLVACQPAEPELVVVTEVVQLGDEQIVITRMVELQPTPTPTIPPTVRPPDPVTLDIAYEGELPDLDPQHALGSSGLDLAESLFVGLTNFNHETEQIEPELAASWRISGDGRTWSFQLRDDIYWVKPLPQLLNPNTIVEPELIRPVDAYDVVFAFQRACSSANAIPDAFLLFNIDGCEAIYQVAEPTESDLEFLGVKAIDSQTVQFTLTEPASNFLTITSLPQFRPVPRELVDEHGDTWRDLPGDIADGWQTPENLVTNGAFLPIASSISDDSIILVKNLAWPLEYLGNINIIDIRFQLDQEEIYALWNARDLDLSPLPASERESVLDTSPEKVRLITNQTVFYLGYNFESPVFQEAPIRRAFSAAINREELTESMFEGRAQALRHFTPPGVFGAPPLNEVGVGFSPDFALQQMDLSSIKNCKLLPPITFLVSTSDLSLLQAELVRDMWVRELGCDEKLITVEQVEFGTLLANTMSEFPGQRPDLWELAWPAYYPDAHNYLSDLFHCTEGENRQNRLCSETDSLMKQAHINPSPEERRSLYRMIENRFFSDSGEYPVIPLYVRGDYLLVQSWVRITPTFSGGKQFDRYLVDQELKRLERSRS